VFRDNASDPETSARAAEELIREECAVVIGSYGDELSAAASDAFRSAGVAAITVSGRDSTIINGNDHYFRICANPVLQGAALANYAKANLMAKSVFCLTEAGNSEDTAFLNTFCAAAETLGLKTEIARFPEDTEDFTPYLKGAAEAGADVIFAPCAAERGAVMIGQAAEIEGISYFISDDRWRNEKILEALSETELTVAVSAAYAEGGDEQFEKGFKEWLLGSEDAVASNGGTDSVSVASVMGYDAYFTAIGAMRMAGSTDKADILAIMPGLTHTGVSGYYSFDEEGNAVRTALWMEKADPGSGKWLSAGQVKIS